MGVWSITTPKGASAFSTADIITAGTGTVPPSPMPLTPIGFLVQSVSEYLIFKDRPSGDYSPLYYPATNPGANVGQQELSIIVGVGTIGEADEIEMTTL